VGVADVKGDAYGFMSCFTAGGRRAIAQSDDSAATRTSNREFRAGAGDAAFRMLATDQPRRAPATAGARVRLSSPERRSQE